MLEHFNAPFVNSTLVIFAWDNERLIGAVRVLSDGIIRSVLYDLVVDPEYRNRGIGREFAKRCREHFPDTEWLVQTEEHISAYYERLGFRIYGCVVLTVPFKYKQARSLKLKGFN